MSVLVVIPARYGSTRFPGKPLAMLRGKPVIQHVYEGAAQAKGVDEAVVATDDQRIAAAVKAFGGEAIMTPSALPSGTHRVAAVARDATCDVVINIQGDEPLMEPAMIDDVANALLAEPHVPMATLCRRLDSSEDIANPNIVKVVRDQQGFALYFSRAPIPFHRGEMAAYWKHLGIYGYQKAALLQFIELSPTPLEQAEQLEQLRAMEHGLRIHVIETTHDTIAVDAPEDLKKVEERLVARSPQPMP